MRLKPIDYKTEKALESFAIWPSILIHGVSSAQVTMPPSAQVSSASILVRQLETHNNL